MASDRSERWPGGYVRTSADGRRTYWIRRRIAGRLYETSTRATSLRAAIAQLERFERDPAGYDPSGEGGRPLRLDGPLSAAFLDDVEASGVSRDHWRRYQKALAWWAVALRGADLRRVSLATITDALPETGRRSRIVAIRRLYSWLRETGRIEASEDPTLDRLRVPQSRPEQWRRPKAIGPADLAKVRARLSGVYRDALDILTGTGWHVAELARFAQAGSVDVYRGDDKTASAVLLCPRHKSGDAHRTAVGPDVEAAARRLREHGGLSISRFHRAILAACDAAGVDRFGPGQLRHTVATWAVEAGEPVEAVAAFLGHRSATTTRRFYATLAVAPKIRTIR